MLQRGGIWLALILLVGAGVIGGRFLLARGTSAADPQLPVTTPRPLGPELIVSERVIGGRIQRCEYDALVTIERGKVTRVDKQAPGAAAVQLGQVVREGPTFDYPFQVAVSRNPQGELIAAGKNCKFVSR